MQRLLDSCDISDPAGVRDYAILMLVARLGLRSIEAARLQLDDLDWRAGRVILRGKASREDGMPLPADVEEALSASLCQARPATGEPPGVVRPCRFGHHHQQRIAGGTGHRGFHRGLGWKLQPVCGKRMVRS